MSYWTHIVGIIHAETYLHEDDIAGIVKKALEDAPRITGSEGPADIFVNAESGHCIWLSCDCFRCEHYGGKCEDGDGGFWCSAPEGYDCPTGEYQSRVIISVQGDLRDRMRAQTRKEWNAFHRYIVKKLGYKIRIATCRVVGW